MSSPKTRCAIYTRKSTDEGLDQEFNSLDAQYEACAAYIASQKHEGWKLVNKRPSGRANELSAKACQNMYADGGISGGTMERDGLRALLADIDAGHIDMIVVYKIDRLTRSLSDFSKIVDRLDARGASFVSVTQSFNTATSMGRLTLNMLLSFAQFEREVTAERIRDKIAASKAKGLWMGGTVPLGYDPNPNKNIRGLIVNSIEAKSVKRIFELYDKLGNLAKTKDACATEGIRSKYRPQYQSRLQGGSLMTNGQIHHILTNPLYIGKIRHKDKTYDGQHEAIIEEVLWYRVQAKLQSASARKRGQSKDQHQQTAPLSGKLFDETGDHLTPTHTKKRVARRANDGERQSSQNQDRIIRYYISNRLIKTKDPTGWRLPAKTIETSITETIRNALGEYEPVLSDTHSITDYQSVKGKMNDLANAKPDLILDLVTRIDLERHQLTIALDIEKIANQTALEPETFRALSPITKPLAIRKRGVEQKLLIGEVKPERDVTLIQNIARASAWIEQIKSGTSISELASIEKKSISYITNRIKLAFLSPKIKTMILEQNQKPHWSTQYFLTQNIPINWRDQDSLFFQDNLTQ